MILRQTMRTYVCAVWLALALVGAASAAYAQAAINGPIVFADGHVAIGGNLSASFGTDDPGFYNYTDYDHSALRMLRLDLSAAVRVAGDHVAVLGELRTENFDNLRPYALYLKIRPWSAHTIDIGVGRIPPTFGAFARRIYPSDNPLIGYPLAYQYLTTMRADSVPASADELIRRRGSGWLTRFSIGDQSLQNGLPLVSAFRWDTGIQLHAATDDGVLSGTAAVTTGTLANPLFHDDNTGRQIVGRLQWQPGAGLIVGGSAARGPFVSSTAARGAVGDGHDRAFTQTAYGADIEYSRGYYLLRAETIVSDWRLPLVRGPWLTLPLRAIAVSAEGRYKFRPGLYGAVRADHLHFSDVTGTQQTATWDAPVTRIEIGGGYSMLRNLILKLSYQYNVRDGGPPALRRHEYQTAAQLVFWF